MKLITETFDNSVSLIKEDVLQEDGSTRKSYFIEGVFLQADVKNRNGRSYPGHVMEREVNKYIESHINTNRAYGELGHPAGPGINLDRVSHMTKKIWKEGSNYIGRAKIMTETPMGKIVKNLLDEGANLGTSSRGLGTLKKVGDVMLVQDDYRLAVAGDIVSDPSGPDCFVKGIMENAEWIYDAAEGYVKVQEHLEETAKQLHSKSLREIQESRLAVFERFIKSFAN